MAAAGLGLEGRRHGRPQEDRSRLDRSHQGVPRRRRRHQRRRRPRPDGALRRGAQGYDEVVKFLLVARREGSTSRISAASRRSTRPKAKPADSASAAARPIRTRPRRRFCATRWGEGLRGRVAATSSRRTAFCSSPSSRRHAVAPRASPPPTIPTPAAPRGALAQGRPQPSARRHRRRGASKSACGRTRSCARSSMDEASSSQLMRNPARVQTRRRSMRRLPGRRDRRPRLISLEDSLHRRAAPPPASAGVRGRRRC